MPVAADTERRRSARHSNTGVAGPSQPVGLTHVAGESSTQSGQPQGKSRKRKAVDTPSSIVRKSVPATIDLDYRPNPFDVHIRDSKKVISQWLTFHGRGLVARAGPVPDLDRTLRTKCDFIMQACGFEIDWNSEPLLTLAEDFHFETPIAQESPETVMDGIRALCKLGFLVCESEVENEYPGFTSAMYIRQALWDLLEEVDVRDARSAAAICEDGRGVLTRLREISSERKRRGLEDCKYGALVEQLESRIADRSVALKGCVSHSPSSDADTPLMTSSEILKAMVHQCMDLAHTRYADLERTQQYQAGKEVARLIDGLIRNAMGESVCHPERLYGDPALDFDGTADTKRIIQCIEALRAIALTIWFGAPCVIPMYLMKEGCIDRLCSCLLALSWSLVSQDQECVSLVLKDGVEGGMIERMRCLDVRMKNYGVTGFRRVVEELERYIVV